MTNRIAATLAVATALLWLPGCGGGGGGGGIEGTGSPLQQGTLRLSITDAPACGFDAVNITIDRVRVHASGNAADADGGWAEVGLNPPKRVDLLTLTNGVLEPLGQTDLPAGKYTQMRLVLAPNTPAAPFANSVKPTGGAETALTTPSAQQSGLKLDTDIDISPGQLAEFALDFDACKSVVRRGNSGQFNLKPVITVLPVAADAGRRVVGHVDPALALGSTQVSVQRDGVPVKATVPDAAGRFVLYPVPAGNYDLVVSAAGRVTAVMTGVPVVSGTPTVVASATLPISPPATTSRAVSGTVTPVGATVRAVQALTGGPTFEAAWGPVDATSGGFSFTLPIGAPVRAAYAAGSAAPNFLPDAAAASRYTLEAAANGATRTQDINTAGNVPPVAFVLP